MGCMNASYVVQPEFLALAGDGRIALCRNDQVGSQFRGDVGQFEGSTMFLFCF